MEEKKGVGRGGREVGGEGGGVKRINKPDFNLFSFSLSFFKENHLFRMIIIIIYNNNLFVFKLNFQVVRKRFSKTGSTRKFIGFRSRGCCHCQEHDAVEDIVVLY